MIKLVYKFLPVAITYIPDAEWPKKYGDCAGWYVGWWFCVRINIKESYRDDKGLLEHELTHARQIYRCPLLYWILYRFAKFRYKFELEAYTVQLGCAPTINQQMLAMKFTGFISNWYGLHINEEQTLKLLLEGVKQ